MEQKYVRAALVTDLLVILFLFFFYSFVCVSVSNQVLDANALWKPNAAVKTAPLNVYDGEVRCSTAVATAASYIFFWLGFYFIYWLAYSLNYVCIAHFVINSRIFSPSSFYSPVRSMFCSAQWQKMTNNFILKKWRRNHFFIVWKKGEAIIGHYF